MAPTVLIKIQILEYLEPGGEGAGARILGISTSLEVMLLLLVQTTQGVVAV